MTKTIKPSIVKFNHVEFKVTAGENEYQGVLKVTTN